MSVVEGLEVLDAEELLLGVLDLSRDLGRVARLEVERRRELADVLLQVLGLGHVVEQLGQEVALLRGDLGGGRVSGDGAVADGPDVPGALHHEVLVDGEAAARVLLGGNLAHEVLDEGPEGVSGGPDQQAVGELDALLAAVGVHSLGLDVLVGDVLDHGLEADVDLLLLEGALGVLNQLLGEGGQDVGQGLDQRNLEAVADVRDQALDVLLEEVLQFAGKLDTSGAATNDDHVQQTVDLVRVLILEGSRLDAVHDLLADALGVIDLLQEARVLANARDSKGRILGTDTNDQHVVGDLSLGDGALDLGLVLDLDDLAVGVDGAGLSLVELDGCLLVLEDGADGVHDGAVLDKSGGARGQEGREEEVVAGRDDDDVVVLGVELLEECDGTPAGTCTGAREKQPVREMALGQLTRWEVG